MVWLVVIVLTAGVSAAAMFLVFSIGTAGLGYMTIRRMAVPVRLDDTVLFAPSIGFIVAVAVTALWLRRGGRPEVSFWLLAVLGLAGVVCLWANRGELRTIPIAHGHLIILISVLICIVYFLPGARHDAVVTPDGGYEWMYIDTQYNMAMAASAKAGNSVRMAGMFLGDLRYHFGPYAMSGSMSAATGVDLGHAFARIVRGFAQYSLLFSTLGLGNLLSRLRGGSGRAGFLSVLGLFFYGSLVSLVVPEQNSSSTIQEAILFPVPHLTLCYVVSNGGPFAHLLLGHSVLYGMIGLTAILAIALEVVQAQPPELWRSWPFFILAGLVACSNSLAGLGAAGIVAVMIIVRQVRDYRAWLCAGLALVTVGAVFLIMGYTGGAYTNTMHPESPFLSPSIWFRTAVWLFIGLGIRVIALAEIKDFRTKPEALLVLLLTAGFGLFSIVMREPFSGADRYGFSFLQSMFSVIAFAMVYDFLQTPGTDASAKIERFGRALSPVLFWGGAGMLLMAIVGVALTIAKVAGSHFSISGNNMGKGIVALAIAAMAASKGLQVAIRRGGVWRRWVGIGLISFYSIGFGAWITEYMNFGLGKMQMQVRLSPGERTGLERLRMVSRPTDRIAVNQHSTDSLAMNRNRCYGYRAYAERPVLLEGWAYGENLHPAFQQVKADNDLLFSATEASQAKAVVDKYNIRFIVAKPGTDLGCSKPLPAWLDRVDGTGTLNVYRVIGPEKG